MNRDGVLASRGCGMLGDCVSLAQMFWNALSDMVMILLTAAIAYAGWRQAVTAERQDETARNLLKLQQAIEDQQAGIGRQMVLSAIDSAITSIKYWNTLPLSEIKTATSLPDPRDLVPRDGSTVLHHARSISAAVGQFMSEGIDRLELARNEIERLKNADAARRPGGAYISTPSRAAEYLEQGLGKFEHARSAIPCKEKEENCHDGQS